MQGAVRVHTMNYPTKIAVLFYHITQATNRNKKGIGAKSVKLRIYKLSLRFYKCLYRMISR